MWSLFKGLVFLVLLAAGIFFAVTVPVGGATLAEHAHDVWRSREVQAKVQRVKAGVSDTLAQKLDRALSSKSAAGEREISDADRKRLEELLRTAR
jgi:hypothetical protein